MRSSPDSECDARSAWRFAWLTHRLPGGIRERLFLLIALTLLPVLILQAWIYYRHYTTRRNEALQTELEVAQGVATTFVNYLNDIHRQLHTAGQAIITFETYTGTKARHLFKTISEQYPTIFNLSWVDPQGFILASSLPVLEGRDLSGRTYFRQIVTGQSWSLGDLMPAGTATEIPIFVIASAIRDNQGTLRGVVVAAIEPTSLGARAFAGERPAGGAFTVFDRQGRLVYCNPETPLTWEMRTRWRQTDRVLQQALEGRAAQGYYTSALSGDRRVAARVPIPGIDWITGASRPARVALGPVWLALLQEAAIGLVVTAGAFLIAYVIARTIADPLRHLEQEAEAMGQGRIGPYADPDSPKEVRRLHTTMARMAMDLIHRAESLRRSEERFRKLFEADLMGVYVTKPDGTILDCNDKMAKMLGYGSREEFRQHPSTDLYVDPKFRREAVRALQRDGIFPGREGLLRCKDGTVIHALGFAVLLTDELTGERYIQGVAVDITDRKQAEKALQESETKFRTVFEQAAIGIGRVCFATARWIDVNEAFCRMLGYEPEEMRATPWPEITHPDDLDLDLVPFRRMAAGELDSYTIEKRFIHKQGHYVWARLTLSLVRNSHGHPDYEIAIIENITERKRAEESLRELTATLESRVAERTAELEQRAKQLQKLAMELSQAEDRERQRLAEVLHDDLQQQLAAVKFHLGMLRNQVGDNAALREAVTPVEVMIKDAIAKSRSLSHELSPARLYHGDFSEAIEWLAHQVQTKHGLVVHMDIRGPIEVSSEAIKAFLFRAAREILFNIVKHAEVAESSIRLRRRRGQLRLTVRDKGRGFDVRTLEHAAGFGLLSIRERVELLGGRMKIRSAPGRGSTFLIAVPDDRMPEAGEARREDKTQKADDRLDLSAPLGPPSPGSPVRVLLADDHKIVREGLAALISEQEDIEVVGQATNGLEAVHLAHELHPDVVVMDVAMPMMPGDEATRQIKRDMPQTRVLGLSMHEEAGVAERMHDAGAEGYMIKTAPSEELLAAIRGAGGIQERVAKGPC